MWVWNSAQYIRGDGDNFIVWGVSSHVAGQTIGHFGHCGGAPYFCISIHSFCGMMARACGQNICVCAGVFLGIECAPVGSGNLPTSFIDLPPRLVFAAISLGTACRAPKSFSYCFFSAYVL
jgi:hypothetical protein